MDPHLVSASLTTEDIQEINAALETVTTKMPFLIDLTMQQRKTIKVGDKTDGFTQDAMAIANQYPDLFPAGFLSEMRKDAQLLQQLSPIALAVDTLSKKLDDTTLQLSGECYAAARTVYNNTNNPFAKAQMRTAKENLGKRFNKKKKAD